VQSFLQFVLGVNPNFGPAADMNCDGLNDLTDVDPFVNSLLVP
jgi:hypothetical protein